MAPRKAKGHTAKKAKATNKKDAATDIVTDATKPVEKKKKTFFDLRDGAVKTCWERILRYALVEEKPITVNNVPPRSYPDYAVKPHTVPGAATFLPRISELGNQIYFSENTFNFRNSWVCWEWFISNKEYAKLLCNVGVDCLECGAVLTHIPDILEKCGSLQELKIGVDELGMIQTMCQPARGYQHVLMRPQDITPQLNLVVLRVVHMDKLRNARIPRVKFTSLIHGGHSASCKHTSGPISDGVLESVVAKEMMQPQDQIVTPVNETPGEKATPKRKRNVAADSDDEYKPSKGVKRTRQVGTRANKPRLARPTCLAITDSDLGAMSEQESEPCAQAMAETSQAFRILELPAELRNQIYRHILLIPGSINPSKRIPTTHHRSQPGEVLRSGPAPCSSLALLQTNKQTCKEATGIYYGQNSFVFYFPNQLMMFLLSISEERKQFITSITLWYNNRTQGDIDSFDVYLSTLRTLKSLKHLELVLDDMVTSQLGYYEGWKMPGEDMMKDMIRGGLDITVRNQTVDTYFWKREEDRNYLSHVASKMTEWRKDIGKLADRLKAVTDERAVTKQ